MSTDPQTPNYPIRQLSEPPPLKRQNTRESANYLPGDFIKPDPACTRLEARKHILKELESCLKERLGNEDVCSCNDAHLTYRSNPRERLFYVGRLLDDLNSKETPGDVSFQILAKYLNKEQIDYDTYPVKLVQLALGFLHTDRLPNERTIYSYWNHSPFTVLRQAPPLTDEDDAIEESKNATGDFENVLTLRITYPSLFVTLACVTIWIAMIVSQLIPVRTYQACVH